MTYWFLNLCVTYEILGKHTFVHGKSKHGNPSKNKKQNKFVNKQKTLQMQVCDMLVLLGILYSVINKRTHFAVTRSDICLQTFHQHIQALLKLVVEVPVCFDIDHII
jgi:hypothetical protein